jgi:hypothetical protein
MQEFDTLDDIQTLRMLPTREPKGVTGMIERGVHELHDQHTSESKASPLCPLQQICYLNAICAQEKANSKGICKPSFFRKGEFIYNDVDQKSNGLSAYVVLQGFLAVQALTEHDTLLFGHRTPERSLEKWMIDWRN